MTSNVNPSDQLLQSWERAMQRLQEIWDRIGIGRGAKEERSSTVLRHLQSLLDDMVEEEETLERQLQTRVQDFTLELAQLTTELNLPTFQPTAGHAVLQVEKELKKKTESLRKEKKERMKLLSKMRGEDQVLCDCMCMTPYYVPSGTTPSGEQLDELKKHVASLTLEKEKRFGTFVKQKKEITDLMVLMDRSPETSFEKEVVNDEDLTFILSIDNMHALDALLAELLSCKTQLEVTVDKLWDRLHTLWERLETPKHEQEMFEDGKEGFKPAVLDAIRQEIEKYEALKLANIQRFVDGMRTEIETWWNKCYYSAQQRCDFKHFSDSNYTEALLTKHEKEVASLMDYYNSNKQLLELVAKREVLFCKMQEFEKRANDPNRFFADRGGKLLLEEKERKSLMKQLPKVENSVTEEIQNWEREHGRVFLVNGMSFIKHIDKTWRDWEETKIREKEEKQLAKTKLMNEEMFFGSKPSTPVKKRAHIQTPTRTPKYRKVDESGSTGSSGSTLRMNETPSSCSRIQHSSTLYASPYKRQPMSTSKVPMASKIMASKSKTAPGSRNRRRSNRLARKVLGEKNEGTNESVFSHTTVASDHTNITTIGGNISVASTGSYKDFADMAASQHSTKLGNISRGLYDL